MNFERIVQITDTHIVSDFENSVLSWDPQVALKEVISSIKSLPIQPSMILATGDLVHDGSIDSYKVLKDILSTSNIPIFAIPGNHDSIENMKLCLVGDNIQMAESTDIERVNWKIIILNTQVPNEEYGNIDSESLHKLERIFKSLKTEHCLIALHHSLTPECPFPSCHLNGQDKFLELITKYTNTKAIISGHTHCQTEKQHLNIKLLTTPSTLFHVRHIAENESEDHNDFMKYHEFDGKRKGYRVLDLYEDGRIESEVCWV